MPSWRVPSCQLFLYPQLLPNPLSEAPGVLSLDKASSFPGLLERVLAEKPGPLGPVALLAILHFLKRVTALRAEGPERPAQPWEELGRGFVSVASLTLEEQSASAWLSIREVRQAGLAGIRPFGPFLL